MDEPGSTLYLAGLLLLMLSAVFSGTETAIFASNRAKLQNMAGDDWRSRKALQTVIEHPHRLLATILVGNTAVNIAFTAIVASISIILWKRPYGALLATAVSLLLLLLFGEVTPKLVAAAFPERLALSLARPIYLMMIILQPLVIIANGISHWFLGIFGRRPGELVSRLVTEEEIRTAVSLGEEAGELEEEEKEMINSIFEFGDTVVHEVMVPRTDMICVDVESPVDEALDMLLESGHSRIPVYEDTVDNIVGILYARDLLACMRDGRTGVSIRETMRPAYYVPEAKKVDDLLRDLRRRRVHMAVVIDEYGGTAGLVTIEDLLEEIVGEIRDEYDVEEEELFRMLDENTWLVDARMSLDEMNELLDTDLPKDGFDSIGGYIYSEIGDIPSAGEKLLLPEQGLEITIDRTEGPRITRVRIKKTAQPPEG